MGNLILFGSLIFFGFIVVLFSVKVVSQSKKYVVERLGKYRVTLDAGFHFIIPFIDYIVSVVNLKEQIIDIPEQSVITKDNVNISIDGVVYIKIEDAQKNTYNVEDYDLAISNLATTTLRSEVGKMNLDDTLSNRDILNVALLNALDSASTNWGVKTMRVEISKIAVPKEIEEAMNLQMKAEREKRAIELEALAKKEAVIREAEALKQKAVLEAEAIERMADAKKYEQERVAEGQKNAMDSLNKSLSENEKAGEFLLAKDRIKEFGKLANSNSQNKFIIPYEVTEIIGALSMFKDIIKKES